MDTELFKMFEEELFDEAKRIVPLVYNNKDLFEWLEISTNGVYYEVDYIESSKGLIIINH